MMYAYLLSGETAMYSGVASCSKVGVDLIGQTFWGMYLMGILRSNLKLKKILKGLSLKASFKNAYHHEVIAGYGASNSIFIYIKVFH